MSENQEKLAQAEYFKREFNRLVKFHLTSELVASPEDKFESVYSINDDEIIFLSGFGQGMTSRRCKTFLRPLLSNIHVFTNLISIHLHEHDYPLFMERWPKSLQAVSLSGDVDLRPLNELHNLQKLGLFQEGLDLAKLDGVALQLKELSFKSCKDENALAMFVNLEWLTYGTHNGSLSPLANMKRLEHLFIEDLRTDSLEGLEGCKQLTNLRIQSNRLKDVSALQACEHLTNAVFVSTGEGIRSIEPLACSKLERLEIPYSAVTDFAPLKNMHHLRKLTLTGTLIDDLSVLSNLEHLETLCLGGVDSAKSSKFFKPLLELPHLQNLYVSADVANCVPDGLKAKVIPWFPAASLSRTDDFPDLDSFLNQFEA